MRRILSCLLVASLMIPHLNAQPNERPFEIRVLFGPAFTVGKTGSSVLDSSTFHSYSKTGFNATITLTYRFRNSTFGIYGIGSWQRNPVDGKEFEKQFIPTAPNPISVVVNSNVLNNYKFLAGPDIKLPPGMDRELSIECSIAAGVLIGIAPNYTINSYYNYTNVSSMENIDFYYGGRLPSAFCYQLSSGVNYQINKLWLLVINASYTHSTPGYSCDSGVNGIEYHYNLGYPVS